MRPEKLESEAEGYTFRSIVAALSAVGSGAIYADSRHPSALVLALGFAFLAVVASRRRCALLKRAEAAQALKDAGL